MPQTPAEPNVAPPAPDRGDRVRTPGVALPDHAPDTIRDGAGVRRRSAQSLAAGRFTITSERRGTAHVIAVAGELDVATAQSVDDALRAAEASDGRKIVLDLSGLDFIDSTGLRVIVMADARSRADGGRLALVRGAPAVHRAFELTTLADRLPFVDS